MEKITDPIFPLSRPRIDFSWTPTDGQYSWTAGETTYTPDGAVFTAVDTEITFTATTAFYDGNEAVAYEWNFGDGVLGYDNGAVHTYKTPSPHVQCTLTVIDNKNRRWHVAKQMYLHDAE